MQSGWQSSRKCWISLPKLIFTLDGGSEMVNVAYKSVGSEKRCRLHFFHLNFCKKRPKTAQRSRQAKPLPKKERLQSLQTPYMQGTLCLPTSLKFFSTISEVEMLRAACSLCY